MHTKGLPIDPSITRRGWVWEEGQGQMFGIAVSPFNVRSVLCVADEGDAAVKVGESLIEGVTRRVEPHGVDSDRLP